MPSPKIFQPKAYAFTLIEIMVCLGICVGIIGTVSVLSVSSLQRALLRNDEDTIVTALVRARAESIERTCSHNACTVLPAHGVHITQSSAIIFEGPSFPLRDTSQDVTLRLSGRSSLTGSIDIVFSPTTGSVDSAASLHIGIKTITVSPIGQISEAP